MARREKKPVHPVQMTDGKRAIIQGLLSEYDIQNANDIQEALKDLLRGTIQEMIHYMNSIPESGLPDEVKVADFEKRYDEILATAKSEYEYEPPGRYNMDGYNLYRRMEKYRDNHLLFLHDIRVPATNNEAERILRSYKRKQAQAVTFRCSESVDALCKWMSMLVLMRRKKNRNIFEEVTDIFWRPKPEPEKKTDSSDS